MAIASSPLSQVQCLAGHLSYLYKDKHTLGMGQNRVYMSDEVNWVVSCMLPYLGRQSWSG